MPAQTLMTTQVPSENNGGSYELGVQVVPDVDGQITAVRFWKTAGESGLHTGRIWSADGIPLASVDFVDETASGWQQQALPAPVSTTANTTYVVSVNSNSLWSAIPNGFATTLIHGNLRAPTGNNGVYGAPATFPTGTSGNYNYFRDLVFVPNTSGGSGDTTPPQVTLTQPVDGATVSGLVTMAATATDDVGVVGVQFQVDGANVGSEVQVGAYSLGWDSTSKQNGP